MNNYLSSKALFSVITDINSLLCSKIVAFFFNMEDVYLPDVINELTKICRICLNDADEMYSINEFGKISNKTVRISEILSECTSIEVI